MDQCSRIPTTAVSVAHLPVPPVIAYGSLAIFTVVSVDARYQHYALCVSVKYPEVALLCPYR